MSLPRPGVSPSRTSQRSENDVDVVRELRELSVDSGLDVVNDKRHSNTISNSMTSSGHTYVTRDRTNSSSISRDHSETNGISRDSTIRSSKSKDHTVSNTVSEGHNVTAEHTVRKDHTVTTIVTRDIPRSSDHAPRLTSDNPPSRAIANGYISSSSRLSDRILKRPSPLTLVSPTSSTNSSAFLPYTKSPIDSNFSPYSPIEKHLNPYSPIALHKDNIFEPVVLRQDLVEPSTPRSNARHFENRISQVLDSLQIESQRAENLNKSVQMAKKS